MTIYQGDTANNLITIELENKTGIGPDIQKAILQITSNDILIPYTEVSEILYEWVCDDKNVIQTAKSSIPVLLYSMN